MAITINLTGITGSPDGIRTLAYVDVTYNANTYPWKVFVPPNVDLMTYINSRSDNIQAQIDAKEAIWANTNPIQVITRFDGSNTTHTLTKNDIVRPDDEDYYIKRLKTYPSIADQLDAIFKGVNSNEFISMANTMKAIKTIYGKQ